MTGNELEAGDRVEITVSALGFYRGMIGYIVSPNGMAPGCVSVRYTNNQNVVFDFPGKWLRKLPRQKDVIVISEDLDTYNLNIEHKYKEQHETENETTTYLADR